MIKRWWWLLVVGAISGYLSPSPDLLAAEVRPAAVDVRSEWIRGPFTNENFFPIGVWLQKPANAPRFKAAGINVYVALWRGPTTNQLAQLEKAGMSLVCPQNSSGLENRNSPVIIAWMHGDEPDNAQSLGQGKGYGPPILPEKIIQDYARMRAADPTRPVVLNLGQGVAWENYIGRGVRRNHLEDYPEYLKGCDIASFDIYPVVNESPQVAGKLEFVARGVKRLVNWSAGKKFVWNCIECTHIGNANLKATPAQVRAEVWMSLIHGSRGLIYFVHQFQPSFREAAILDDPEMLAAITAINGEIRQLAPALNSPSIRDGVSVSSSNKDKETVSIAWMMKRHGSVTHLFAVNMENKAASVTFRFADASGSRRLKVLSESRTVALDGGKLEDDFAPYGVHLYESGIEN